MRTRIKICGFTRADDAACAARLGIDAIGLVFYPPSPRNVNIAQAQQIIKVLPAFTSVTALFVNAAEHQVSRVLRNVAVDIIQFHGDEEADFCRSFTRPYIKAVRMRQDIDISAIMDTYHDAAGMLLDAYHPGVAGGTGKRFDWQLIPAEAKLPIILAGGLTPENACQAVRIVQPYALDVSSGVETGKGLKDAEKMAAFVKEVNEGDRHR